MTFHTYLLKCADGSYYAGHTDDLEHHIAQHQSGSIAGYTATRLPVSLVWTSPFGTRDEALTAELQIKGWSRKKKEALIAGDLDALPALARKSFDTPLRQAQQLLRTNGGEERASASMSAPASSSLGSARRLRPGRTEDAGRPTSLAPQPIIVLVRPQLGQNIGKAARAMLNFGLTRLRLVSPRDGWPNPDAGPSAAGADALLAEAELFETLADAVADCTHVFATTVRKRGVTKPVMTPDEAARTIHAEPGQCAIVFGPERSGLDTEDVALARTILTVPINPEFGSLNLAQAVIIAAYEWSKLTTLEQPPLTDLLPPAPQEELEGMIAQLEVMLEESGYYFPPGRAPTARLTLRTLLTKPGWNHLEVRTLRGVLTSLARPRRR